MNASNTVYIEGPDGIIRPTMRGAMTGLPKVDFADLVFENPATDVTMEVFGLNPRCPFCKRIWDRDFMILGQNAVGFEPLNPVVPGHMLFVPITHEIDPGPQLLGAFELAGHYANYHGKDYNFILNHGTNATQTIEHLHVHYVPRKKDDGLKLPWTGQVKRQVVKIIPKTAWF